jgi:hypothetical protein
MKREYVEGSSKFKAQSIKEAPNSKLKGQCAKKVSRPPTGVGP